MAENTFKGTNARTLSAYLDSADADLDVINNTKNGKLFAQLSTGKTLTISSNAESKMREEIDANGNIDESNFQVVDMPDMDTNHPGVQRVDEKGQPKTFALITVRSKMNIVATVKHK